MPCIIKVGVGIDAGELDRMGGLIATETQLLEEQCQEDSHI